MERARWMRALAGLALAGAVVAGCGKGKQAITTPDDAKNSRIGVMLGTVGEVVTRARFPKAKIQTFEDLTESVAALKAGKLDAVVTSYPGTLGVLRENPDLRTLPESLGDIDASIAVKKGNAALLAELNEVLTRLKGDGTLADLKKRWMTPNEAPAAEREVAPSQTGKVLRVGVCATREPFTFLDTHGRVTGHDAELVRIIAARLRRPVQFSDLRFMALIPALNAGKIDLIITGVTSTSERKQFVDFTQPYFANTFVMLVKKPGGSASGPAKLAAVDDLADKRIGVLLGSVHDTYATKTYPNATILQYKSPSDILLAVKSGKIDAAIYTHETLLEIFRSDTALGPLGNKLFSVPIGMGFNKANDELRETFNAFLRKLKTSGVYDDMVRRWITDGTTQMPNLQTPSTNGVLTVGFVSDKGLPFAIVKDNERIGFDIELTQRFAASIGKQLKLQDMEFGSLIAAAATNKIDMIASTLMITEERKKLIGFSDPYYNLGATAFALKSRMTSFDSARGTAAALPFWRGVAESFRSNLLTEKRYLLIFDGLKTTVLIAVLATGFGTVLGALVCWLRMSKKRLLRGPARAYIAVLRGTPVLVVLMLIFYVVFASVDINPVVVAVLAFGLNFAAYSAEIFRTGIEGVDRGQTEAGIAMGFTKVETFVSVVLPQTVARILPVFKGEVISLVKMTSVVGYIAVQDLTKASDIIRSRTFDAFFPLVLVAFLYFVLSWLLLQVLEALERRTDPKFRRRKAGAA